MRNENDPVHVPKEQLYGDLQNNMRHRIIYLIIKHTSRHGIKQKTRKISSWSAQYNYTNKQVATSRYFSIIPLVPVQYSDKCVERCHFGWHLEEGIALDLGL